MTLSSQGDLDARGAGPCDSGMHVWCLPLAGTATLEHVSSDIFLLRTPFSFEFAAQKDLLCDTAQGFHLVSQTRKAENRCAQEEKVNESSTL